MAAPQRPVHTRKPPAYVLSAHGRGIDVVAPLVWKLHRDAGRLRPAAEGSGPSAGICMQGDADSFCVVVGMRRGRVLVAGPGNASSVTWATSDGLGLGWTKPLYAYCLCSSSVLCV